MKLFKMIERRKKSIIEFLINNGVYNSGDYRQLFEIPLKDLEKEYRQIQQSMND
ncbi:Fur-regulated basic protein FbpA [Metabacillus arenae]|uniref:Fur-regulated basic protein FbpA n=1 Tax=Metabacillus arenae TaxID=2771434 RepID=A0A926NGX0_9BACI|nr:Fur-regulated basic protein FbpA [Metabacillus arenae]MBD1381071.1 Fur-regulated basic protein FbpA [Metabacillus arenae]